MTRATKASIPFYRFILLLVFILGAFLILGGIYVALTDHFAQTDFELFGIKFTSTSVGVTLSFIGIVVVIIPLRRILDSFDQTVKLGDEDKEK